jgi:hypothetical protein
VTTVPVEYLDDEDGDRIVTIDLSPLRLAAGWRLALTDTVTGEWVPVATVDGSAVTLWITGDTAREYVRVDLAPVGLGVERGWVGVLNIRPEGSERIVAVLDRRREAPAKDQPG